MITYGQDNTMRCNYEISNGNTDDPDFAYCGLPHAHAGDHGEWTR